MSKTSKTMVAAAALALLLGLVLNADALLGGREEVFTDQAGREVRLEDFRGKTVLMNFIMVSCPHHGCELMSSLFLRTQMLLKDRMGKELFLVSVSVDPDGKSPAELREYAERYKADPGGWLFLTGDTKTIDRVSKRYGVIWKTDADGARHHKIVIALLDKNGEKAAVYDNPREDTEKIVREIKELLDRKG